MGKIRQAGPSAIWSHDVVMMFCDLCLREIARGNRPNTHFNKAGWRSLVRNFKKYSGRDYDRLQLKNKWDLLKKDWKIWKDLKKAAVGFGWNSKRNTFDASEEWWTEKIKEFPTAKKFRYHGFDPQLEEKLDKMFLNMVPGDDLACVPTSAPSTPGVAEEDEPREFEDCESSKSLSGDEKVSNELSRPDISSQRVNQISPYFLRSRNKISSPKSAPSNVAQGVSPFFQEQMRQAKILQTQIQQLVDAVTKRSKASVALSKPCSTIAEAVRELDCIEELEQSPDLYGYAVDLLMQKDSREMFMALKPRKRIWYLMREFEKSRRGIM
ncbi:hypothetical protein HPP92_018135 [Vanilla planifolia]|uniref:Myb/SANT-like domain-containing protein n=1 Tax=Vanilla planifolia TaxID=51239 RepID=A0A835UN29_VANPL|nr:hypothetical protein HPP92_018135 [Vanilla planifolia]